MSTNKVIIINPILLVCTMIMAALPVSAEDPLRVIPEPARISSGQGFLVIDPSFHISLNRDDALLRSAAARLARNLSAKTGLKLALEPVMEGKPAALRVFCDAADPHFLTPQADESYTLRVTTAGAELRAHGPTEAGGADVSTNKSRSDNAARSTEECEQDLYDWRLFL